MGDVDIDDLVVDQEEHEGRTSGSSEQSAPQNRVLVGMVERFFEKINVVAIVLARGLKVGDTIEFEGEEGKFTIKVSSMQINKQDVASASEGDSVGIKVPKQVVVGSGVYMSA